MLFYPVRRTTPDNTRGVDIIVLAQALVETRNIIVSDKMSDKPCNACCFLDMSCSGLSIKVPSPTVASGGRMYCAFELLLDNDFV